MTVKKANEQLNLPQGEYYGLSTDTKPTDCDAGSTFWECDTAKGFVFDGCGKWWPVS